MKSQYIDFSTKVRAEATSEFEKDLYKLMNNSVYGKKLENIRNRVDIRLRKRARKLIAKPNFDRCTIFHENLVAIHMIKTEIVFNKPVYSGAAILDLSKIVMYNFHYNYIKPEYGDNARVLFTDTDSLMYEIKTDDFYMGISDDVKDRFDTSNYPPNHPSGIPSGFNTKVVGVMKDEIMEEFVGLRAKLYSFKMYEGEETKKCKELKSLSLRKIFDMKTIKDACLQKNQCLEV